MKTTAVIIVNWNGWKDTIECLSSFAWPQPNTHFYIIDNASQDNSLTNIQSWLTEQNISHLTCTPENLDQLVTQPLPPQSAPRQSAPPPQAPQQSARPPQSAPPPQAPPQPIPQVILVTNPFNAGFGGANNTILRHLLRTHRFDRAWLLNNDTIVTKDSLPQLENYLDADPARAFAGSVLLDYAKPDLVQCCAVRYYKYLGLSKLYLKNKPWQDITHTNAQTTPHPTDYYQIGASLLVNIHMLNKIGLMDERYFMYSEEADWQIRAQKMGLGNGLAWKSVIYHKGNMSTTGRKHVFFYHYNRSAIILTRKNFGKIAGITATFALTGITMLRSKCRPKQFLFGLKGLFAGWQQPIAKIA